MPTTSTDPRAAAAALLVPGTTCHGFAVERCETVPELDSDAYVLRHAASGARLLYLACDDENKAFAIGFKTPPADSTGVFHILEHSVLCGSAKFPVKEPFVDLIKSSMQTFLNAMTYPDKTIYPVATTNERDLYNLMDVYLDAVFNPAIYTKPTIFEQEGWHYELDLPEGAGGDGSAASLREGTLRYNGVVFNEMKGALSDPMSVLDDAVNAALYPDTAYAASRAAATHAPIPELHLRAVPGYARTPLQSFQLLHYALRRPGRGPRAGIFGRALSVAAECREPPHGRSRCRRRGPVRAGAQSAGRAGARDLRV